MFTFDTVKDSFLFQLSANFRTLSPEQSKRQKKRHDSIAIRSFPIHVKTIVVPVIFPRDKFTNVKCNGPVTIVGMKFRALSGMHKPIVPRGPRIARPPWRLEMRMKHRPAYIYNIQIERSRSLDFCVGCSSDGDRVFHRQDSG